MTMRSLKAWERRVLARRVAAMLSEVRRGEASGATHKDNVPGARHWILNEILAAGCRALYERRNSSAVALADATCPVFR